jgi:hypothetical protein
MSTDITELGELSTAEANASTPQLKAPKLNRKEFRRLRALMRRAPKQKCVDKAKRNVRNKIARVSRRINRAKC